MAGSPYAIVPSAAVGSGLANYTITYVDGKLTVNPAALTITANSASKTYGNTATFASTAFTETGLVTANGNTITGVTETSTGAPASALIGTYAIVPSAAVGSGLANYTITYANGKLTVNPAPLTITANSASKTYGNTATFASTAFTEIGLVTANGDTITGVTETSTGASASALIGTYAIVPSAAVGNGLVNYTIRYVDGTLTVGATSAVAAGLALDLAAPVPATKGSSSADPGPRVMPAGRGGAAASLTAPAAQPGSPASLLCSASTASANAGIAPIMDMDPGDSWSQPSAAPTAARGQWATPSKAPGFRRTS